MLFELIYHSQAKPHITEDDHAHILSVARSFNKENDITGCLLYHKGQFLQLLEGDFEKLNELYGRIRDDKRHENVITLHMKEIDERIFDDWFMAYKFIQHSSVIEEHTGVQEFKELPTEKNESKSQNPI